MIPELTYASHYIVDSCLILRPTPRVHKAHGDQKIFLAQKCGSDPPHQFNKNICKYKSKPYHFISLLRFLEPASLDHIKNGQIPLKLCVNPGVISQFGLETLPPGKRKRELCTPAPTQGHSTGQECFRAAEGTGTDSG